MTVSLFPIEFIPTMAGTRALTYTLFISWLTVTSSEKDEAGILLWLRLSADGDFLDIFSLSTYTMFLQSGLIFFFLVSLVISLFFVL